MSVLNRKPLLKVILLGDSGVGKTSLMNRYVKDKFKSLYRRTIGADFFVKDVIVDDKVVTMQVWDTAGQERFQSLGLSFYRGSDCVILVHDVTSPASRNSLKIWKEEFLTQGAPNDPKNFPFIVLANKIDLVTGVFREDNLQDVLECDHEVPHYQTSAKFNVNVEKAFLEAARMALNRDRSDIYFASYPECMIKQKTKSHCY